MPTLIIVCLRAQCSVCLSALSHCSGERHTKHNHHTHTEVTLLHVCFKRLSECVCLILVCGFQSDLFQISSFRLSDEVFLTVKQGLLIFTGPERTASRSTQNSLCYYRGNQLMLHRIKRLKRSLNWCFFPYFSSFIAVIVIGYTNIF